MDFEQRQGLTILNARTGLNCHLEGFPRIMTSASNLSTAARSELVVVCENIFRGRGSRVDEPSRVAAAKVIVALLPDSLLIVKRWLRKSRPESVYEIHFSLFCFLDQVQHYDVLKSVKKTVLNLVASYIETTTVDKADACWMASDLLGDHWSLREALPVLVALNQDVSALDVKLCLLAAFGKALSRASKAQQSVIRRTLLLTAINDPNPSVRAEAAGIMNHTDSSCKM